jgi:hypothetical protein
MQTMIAVDIGGKRLPLFKTTAGWVQYDIMMAMSFVILEDMFADTE